MKNLILLVLFCCFISKSNAQLDGFADNPKWRVVEQLLGTPQISITQTVECTSQTNICNKTYSVLSVAKDTFYVRNQGKKTFLRWNKDCTSKEFLLYDFDLKVGDSTWVVSAKKSDSMQVKLLSTNFINVGLETYEAYNLECSFKNSKQKRSMVWIDNIGCLDHPLYFYQILPPLVDGSSFQLMCYQSKNNSYDNPNYPNCKPLPYGYKPFPLFQDKPQWEVIEDTYYNGPDAQTEEYLSLSYTKDTMICGLKYSKATFKKQNIYIRNEGKSTYAKLIPNCNSSEMLLYSFDINNFPFFDTLTVPGTKTIITGFDLNLTIDSVVYSGKKHFRVKINVKNSFYNETWIEGVGSTKHPFELLAGRQFTIDGPFWSLACFKDNSQQLSMSKQYNCNADFKPFPLEQDNPLWSELLKQNQFSGGTTYITEKIKYQGKSNFCGKDYSLLNYRSYQMYVRNDGKKTYFRLSNNCNEKEYLLYDFDMKVGDKKYFPMQLNSAKIDSSLFTLKKIDTVWHNFQKNRRFYYDFEYYKSNSMPPNVEIKTMVLQEGVGSLWHPFFPLTRLWASKVDGASFELLCADVNNEARFRLRFDLNCNIKIVDIDDLSATANNWFISPNPFDENINISNDENTENTSILIFDLNGKTIYNADFQSNTNIDTSNFAKGIYFIQLKNNGKKVVQKMVKI